MNTIKSLAIQFLGILLFGPAISFAASAALRAPTFEPMDCPKYLVTSEIEVLQQALFSKVDEEEITNLLLGRIDVPALIQNFHQWDEIKLLRFRIQMRNFGSVLMYSDLKLIHQALRDEIARSDRTFDRRKLGLAILTLPKEKLQLFDHNNELDTVLGFHLYEVNRAVSDSIQTSNGTPARFGQERVWQGYDSMPQTGWLELREMMAGLDLKPGQTVVDLGAGFGRLGMLLGLLYPEVSFIGYEIVPERVEESKRVQKILGLSKSKVQFIPVDMSLASFKPAMADIYYAWYPVSETTGEKLFRDLKEISITRPFRLVLLSGFAAKDFSWLELKKNNYQSPGNVYATKSRGS